jgi:hypothetical protein
MLKKRLLMQGCQRADQSGETPASNVEQLAGIGLKLARVGKAVLFVYAGVLTGAVLALIIAAML